ncbi:MAG: hypothetical protein DWP95_11275 [Proteobacteria bacterium]|nr:MAG: hypothetical protein DWP95_11275 [Pseudomonadota bacterium]
MVKRLADLSNRTTINLFLSPVTAPLAGAESNLAVINGLTIAISATNVSHMIRGMAGTSPAATI